jgi:hypothetical protein
MKRFVLAFVMMAGLIPHGWAAERPAFVRGVRPLGMGDAFSAMADDQNIFFYNPAGTVQRTGGMVTLLELPVTIGEDFKDAYDFISDNEDKLTEFDTLSGQEQADLIRKMDETITPLNPSLAVGVPNVNYLAGGEDRRVFWGIGGFGQVQGSFKLNTGIVPSVDYDLNQDAIIPLNLAVRFNEVRWLPGKLGVGTNLKYIKRNQIRDERVSFLQLEDFDSPPVQSASGFGADLGFLYQPNSRWNFALTSLDFLGTSLDFDEVSAEKGFQSKPSRTSSIKARWNLGFAWTPGRFSYWPGKGLRTGNRLTLAMDIRDIANSESKVFFDDGLLAETAGTHIHLGAEYRWWFLRLRGGFNQGYPSFGLGVDWPLLKLDYAYFSDELGRHAGTLEQANHMLALGFRFGAGKTEARERIRNPGESMKEGEKEAIQERAMESEKAMEAAPAETPAQ